MMLDNPSSSDPGILSSRTGMSQSRENAGSAAFGLSLAPLPVGEDCRDPDNDRERCRTDESERERLR